MKKKPSRREVIVAGAALAVVGPTRAFAALPTPAQTEGPFYPDVMPLDTDFDLVKVASRVREAGGEILNLTGRIVDMEDRPVERAVVEIWQADATGHYINTNDRNPADKDPDFQGFGRVLVDAEGRYRFRTIRPVSYPGRTPHIHFKVYRPTGPSLVTQMYVTGEPGNARDGVYQSLTRDEQAQVTIDLTPVTDDDAKWAGNFTVVVAY